MSDNIPSAILVFGFFAAVLMYALFMDICHKRSPAARRESSTDTSVDSPKGAPVAIGSERKQMFATPSQGH